MSYSYSYWEKFGNVFDAYRNFLDGDYAVPLQYKGGPDIGTDYISRVKGVQVAAIQNKIITARAMVKNPDFETFFKDNWMKLVLLNPFERLIAAFQAYPSLKARFHQPGTFSHTFTEIMNEGAFKGTLKGLVPAFGQFGLVLYPSVYQANRSKSGNKFWNFLSTFSALDAFLYPLDTIKNILYADTLGKFNIFTVTRNLGLLQLYKGISFKLAYNIPVLSGFYCSTQVGYERQAFISWLFAAILYPLNTIKVREQLSISVLSSLTKEKGFISHSFYKGVIPFILINAFLGWSLRPLFSQAKLAQIHHQVLAQRKEKLGI